MLSRVRKLSEVLLANPKYVTLNEGRTAEVANILSREYPDFVLPRWDFDPLYPKSDDFEEMCQFYLIFNAINYCYFDQDGKRFSDEGLSGSTLAATRLTEARKEIKDPVFLSHVDENYLLSELFRAEGPISLVKERAAALREVGTFLSQNAHVPNLFWKYFRKYRSNAYVASQALATHLPSWSDPFAKRAQLFVGMVYGRFQDDNPPITKESLEDLTVFADYKVPETLIRMGIIVPSAALMTRLHRQEFIGSGSRKELEIRAATILGADMLMKALNSFRPDDGQLSSLNIDYLLWISSRNSGISAGDQELFIQNHIKHHLTMTTDY